MRRADVASMKNESHRHLKLVRGRRGNGWGINLITALHKAAKVPFGVFVTVMCHLTQGNNREEARSQKNKYIRQRSGLSVMEKPNII